MTKLSAVEIVDKLLEYTGATPPPAGGPDDPWRQGGFKKFKFTAKDVFKNRSGLGPRKGAAAPPGEPPAEPTFKHDLTQRFKWKPAVQN